MTTIALLARDIERYHRELLDEVPPAFRVRAGAYNAIIFKRALIVAAKATARDAAYPQDATRGPAIERWLKPDKFVTKIATKRLKAWAGQPELGSGHPGLIASIPVDRGLLAFGLQVAPDTGTCQVALGGVEEAVRILGHRWGVILMPLSMPRFELEVTRPARAGHRRVDAAIRAGSARPRRTRPPVRYRAR